MWVLAVGLAGGYGFWPVLEVEGEREVGGSLSDGWVLAMGMGGFSRVSSGFLARSVWG